ncbi:hypothetical protein HD806DRAFT_339161 [Xylariaceae sp. AK1471]|nr:hypothetical protein HD806DRAFT_339161 [Xylariaceae sp. AK1471]
MEQVRIHTKIHSRYQVFDASGHLPFSIVFGLCRRSPTDTDARPLVLHTTHSALDLPFALSHGLLTLHEQHGGEQDTQIDLSGQLKSPDNKCGTYLTLSSPVNRTETKWEAFTVYQYRIDTDSQLASVLQPRKKYTIRLVSEDLGVKWWAYEDGNGNGNGQQLLNNQRSKTTQASETGKLVNSKSSAGKASFTVVPTLPFPPKAEVHMRLCRNEESTSDADGAISLEISVSNTGARPIVVQTRGRQRFLVPWGPFQPEDVDIGYRPRIIDVEQPTPGFSLKIVDVATNEVMHQPRNPGPCGLLTDSTAYFRPRLEALVTLRPGEPLIRRVNVSRLLGGLPDGNYRVRTVPRGVWWCFGNYEEIVDEGDDRVPQQLYETKVPPLMLETEDFVELQIEDGRVVR